MAFRRRLREEATAYFAMLKTWMRWMQPRQPRPHDLPGKLVVSLTSYPRRYGCVPHVLRNLLSQSVAPDEIVLWIAHDDAPALSLPILRLRKYGLSIRFCGDLKSFKKIVPTLDAYPNVFIATADDDVYYHPTWLEELVSTWTGSHNEIVFHRGHTITLDEDGFPQPYRRWRFQKIEKKVSTLSFPTGIGGVLYPPGALDPQVTDVDTFTELCPYADDVWLYWMGRRAGSYYRHVGSSREMVNWPGSQIESLFATNWQENRNDTQISQMVKRFGFP